MAELKEGRARNWTFLVYPESAPNNWRDILDEEHIQWVESPLHDKDTNADGMLKKSHWHILLLFDEEKGFEQVRRVTNMVNATIPQICVSVKGLVRYMAHMNNLKKVQYDKNLIVGHGGVDVTGYLKPVSYY